MVTIQWVDYTYPSPPGGWKVERATEAIKASEYAAQLHSVNEVDGNIPIRVILSPGATATKPQIQAVLDGADLMSPSEADITKEVRENAEGIFTDTPGLSSATVAQAETYIYNNATDLAGVIVILKLIVRMLIALRNDRWPDIESR